MNKIYRLVWNAVAGAWVVADERAKGHKKSGAGVLAGAVVAVFAACSGTAFAGSLDGGTATGNNAAYGQGAYASSSSSTTASTAVGHNAYVDSNGGIAIGESATAKGGANPDAYSANQPAGIAIGEYATSNGQGAITLGGYANAQHDNSTAIGYQASATQAGATALGAASNASGANALALGYGAAAGTANSVALGANAVTAAAVATANTTIGGTVYSFAGTSPVGVVSVGSAGAERQITNVAAGQLNAASTDAVNGSQLYATNQQVTQNTTDIGSLKGQVAQNTTDITSLQGNMSNLQGQMADAVLYDSSAHNSVTLGGVGSTTPVALHNVAAGAVNGSSFDAVNGSQLYSLAASTASAIGGGSTVNPDGSITAPAYSVGGQTFNNAGDAFTNIDARTTANADAISNLQGQTADAVMYDSSAHDSVTLGGVGSTTPVALHNVAAGAVNGSSFDAVNGSQLYSLASSTASAIGGGSTVNPDGSITAPAYSVGGQTFNNAGDAFTNIDGRVNDLSNEISSGTIGLVQQDPATMNITVAKATGGTVVDFTGTAGTRQLTGVSAGAVNATSVDAVNGSQLYATNQNVAQNTSDIANLQTSVTNLQGQAANSVAYDSSAHDSLTLGGAGATTAVALHNVADATADGDAVNLGQMNSALAAVSQEAANAANPFVAANGNRDTEAAVATGTHATALGANANASADNSVALGANSVADRANTVSVGSAGNERQITNVAAGTAGTDAVNVDQLNAAMAQSSGDLNSRFSGMQSQIDDAKKGAFGAAAAAMAVAGLPQPTQAGKTMVAAGASHIGGQTGMALGVSYVTESNKWVGKVAASSSSQGNTGVTVGAGYQW